MEIHNVRLHFGSIRGELVTTERIPDTLMPSYCRNAQPNYIKEEDIKKTDEYIVYFNIPLKYEEMVNDILIYISALEGRLIENKSRSNEILADIPEYL